MSEVELANWSPADLWALCDRYPSDRGRRGLRDALMEALDLERAHLSDAVYNGWQWSDVRVQPQVLNQALLAGVIRLEFHSRSQTCYRVNDRARLVEALSAYQGAAPRSDPGEMTGPLELPAGAFDVVVGHDEVKELLRRAIGAPRPVHVLLTGPPGTAKTLFLQDLAGIPGARFALGGATSRAGLLDYLLAQPNCRVLVYDEIDKAGTADLAALLSIMESGMVSRLKHGKAEQERRQVWVVAGANHGEKLPAELLSRFAVRELRQYSPKEFESVVGRTLVKREHVDPEMAWELARALSGLTQDVRTAVRAARLCNGDRQEIPTALKLLGILA